MLNITKLSLPFLFLVACGNDDFTSRPNVDPTRGSENDSDFVTSGEEMSESGESSESSGSDSSESGSETGMENQTICKEYIDPDVLIDPKDKEKFTVCGNSCFVSPNCGGAPEDGIQCAPDFEKPMKPSYEWEGVCVSFCDNPEWNGPNSWNGAKFKYGPCDEGQECVKYTTWYICAEIPED